MRLIFVIIIKRRCFENIRKPPKSLYPQIGISYSQKIRTKSKSDTFSSNLCENDNKQGDRLEPHLHFAGNLRFSLSNCISGDEFIIKSRQSCEHSAFLIFWELGISIWGYSDLGVFLFFRNDVVWCLTEIIAEINLI